MKRLLLASTVALLVAQPAPARAQRHGRPQRPAAELVRLNANRVGDELVVDYQIEERSWRKLRGQRLSPVMHIQLRGSGPRAADRAFSAEVARPQGRITVPVPRGMRGLKLAFWLSDAQSDEWIEWSHPSGIEAIVFGPEWPGAEAAATPPPVVAQPYPQPAYPQPAVYPPQPTARPLPDPATARACARLFPRDDRYARSCLDAVEPSRAAVALVDACGAAVQAYEPALECLRTGARAAFDPLPMLRACDQVLEADADVVECLKGAAAAQREPSAAVAACRRTRGGRDVRLGCIQATVSASYAMDGALQACAEIFQNPQLELRCVRQAAASGGDPTPIIRSCATRRGEQNVIKCVEAALGN